MDTCTELGPEEQGGGGNEATRWHPGGAVSGAASSPKSQKVELDPAMLRTPLNDEDDALKERFLAMAERMLAKGLVTYPSLEGIVEELADSADSVDAAAEGS